MGLDEFLNENNIPVDELNKWSQSCAPPPGVMPTSTPAQNNNSNCGGTSGANNVPVCNANGIPMMDVRSPAKGNSGGDACMSSPLSSPNTPLVEAPPSPELTQLCNSVNKHSCNSSSSTSSNTHQQQGSSSNCSSSIIQKQGENNTGSNAPTSTTPSLQLCPGGSAGDNDSSPGDPSSPGSPSSKSDTSSVMNLDNRE